MAPSSSTKPVQVIALTNKGSRHVLQPAFVHLRKAQVQVIALTNKGSRQDILSPIRPPTRASKSLP